MKKGIIAFILCLIGLFSYRCQESNPEAPARLNLTKSDGCVACHTDANQLKALATPLPPANGESGEG